MYEQDEEYMDEGEDGDEISNEIWQEVSPSKSLLSLHIVENFVE